MTPTLPIDVEVQTDPCQAPTARLLHQLFERQADARPQSTAVVFGRNEATYAGLERSANRLARYLRRRRAEQGFSEVRQAHGPGRSRMVAMMLPRSLDAYTTLLGILKSGAAYVPIDPEYPPERVAYILQDSGAQALVTTAELARSHAAFPGAVIRVDADGQAIAAESSARLSLDEVGTEPRDLCYVIYTSGSTGRPKGVMVEHRNAWHLVRAESAVYRVRPEDRVYQGAPLCFDLSVEEIWLAFLAGATLVAATPEMAHAGPDLSRRLTEHSVTVFSCVPTLLSMLTEDEPTVRLLILGGGTCPDQLVARWARPGRRIVNTYGPTETTVIATYAELNSGKPVTIGRAVPGYRVYLLDDKLRPVPRGEVGETSIGGAGVARGYVGLPEETLKRFVPDPFAPPVSLEWDLTEIGDRVALNDDCVLQTHLFEDRVLKASRLQIGADCAVGADSVVLYDSVMEDGARLDALSLLMKGETLPAGTVWAGIPAEWQDRAGAGILETMREPSALRRGDSAALRLTSARPGPSPDILVPLAE